MEGWKRSLSETYQSENQTVCLYIHLPFCEELCTFCACNKRITKNHGVEIPYVQSILKEWELYKEILGSAPSIKEIHLGGGTPTFFSPQHLTQMLEGILKGCSLGNDFEFSIEIHPNFTQFDHLKSLREIGFNRVSLGVQDFDPKVQYIINRIQTYEQTKRAVDWARKLGYSSVNFDLIYGLPLQTIDSIRFTLEKVEKLRPDRIAFYSYAHVPWKSKGQRRYTDEDVPKGEEKIQMYLLGSQMLNEMGYFNIGMDHFALPGDPMLESFKNGKLHRNFMGYTTTNSKLLIGLGASSIGDSWGAMAQNEKTVEEYQAKVSRGEIPLINGHILTENEIQTREQILNIMCRQETNLATSGLSVDEQNQIFSNLEPLLESGLVEKMGSQIMVTETGKLFLRNIAAAFDPSLNNLEMKTGLFSRSV